MNVTERDLASAIKNPTGCPISRVCPSCEGLCYGYVKEGGEIKKVPCERCKGTGFIDV